MTPSYTSGCACPEYCAPMPDPLRCVRQTPFRSLTLSRLMAVSGEYLWLKRVPPFVIQPSLGGTINCWAENAGAGLMAVGGAGICAATGSAVTRVTAVSQPKRRAAAIRPAELVECDIVTPPPSRLESANTNTSKGAFPGR